MNCWHCQTELIWGGDFDFEDYGLEDEGIVSNLSCPNCNTYVEVFCPISGHPLKIQKKDKEN